MASMFLQSRAVDGSQPFRISVIGGNWPSIDIYAETQINESTYCAVFQVKSTELMMTESKRLPISIPKEKLRRLSKFALPTYLIAVKVTPEYPMGSKAYVSCVSGSIQKGIGSVEMRHELTSVNLLRLKEDVVNFWSQIGIDDFKLEFNSEFS